MLSSLQQSLFCLLGVFPEILSESRAMVSGFECFKRRQGGYKKLRQHNYLFWLHYGGVEHYWFNKEKFFNGRFYHYVIHAVSYLLFYWEVINGL